MWHFQRPTGEHVGRFLEAQRRLPATYVAGVTKGFNVDEERVCLGQGEAVFLAACRALEEWRMFPRGWTEVIPQRTPVAVNQVVAVLARVLGLWWLNACRITSITDDIEPVRRFGFTYATLPGHVERGEESFVIEWDRNNDVWYEIRAISRPRYWAVWLAYPVARRLQHRFRRDSQRAMQTAIRPS